MEYERFKAIVEAYGATPSRWPESERAAAETFARADARAGVLLREASLIDVYLDSAAERADAQLSAARAMRRFHNQSAVRTLASPSSRAFWALAASAVIGVVLGVGASFAPASAEPEFVLTEALQAPLADTEEDFGG